jgi:hypothetical protein
MMIALFEGEGAICAEAPGQTQRHDRPSFSPPPRRSSVKPLGPARFALLTVARMRRHFSDIETSVAGVAKESGRKMLSIACTSLRLRAPTWRQCPVIREQRHGLLFNRPPKLFPRRMGDGAGKNSLDKRMGISQCL